jgi:RNA polymerase sigma-70 factor (ECF subfamily)
VRDNVLGALDSMREAREEASRLERARRGDRDAFDALVRMHCARVYALLFRVIGNHEDAEDLAQETFVRAFRSLAHYRGDAAFSTWLFRIALHLARDHHRRRGTGARVVGLDDVPAPAAAPEVDATRRELARGLSLALDKLPHALRAALVLRLFEGLEYEEIARATGVRPGTARTQVMKARRLLLRLLAPFLERTR